MASIKSLCCIRLLLLLVLTSHVIVNGDEQKNFYIVYMGERPSSILGSSMIESHANVLSTVMESSLVASHIVRSYTKSFSAFAAKLTPNEAEQLSSKDGVISVFPNRYHQLATRHSWDFIGFPQTVKRNLKLEGDIVVGLLDSGITPESESFNDEGFGPPPAKWKGTCGPYANFTGCNNKLIGARYYKLDGEADPLDISSPTDVKGHGTHTASTIAGNLVEGANLYGLAQGTARGAVPSARIAMYKVCWVSNGCSDMDILAAFDASIADGVDVISVSLGGNMARSYFSDAIAIGSFHAMQKGIITTAAAGNDGPVSASVANFAPWMLTVAASATDRQFRSKVVLGNGKEFEGIGVNTYVPRGRFYPLISGADAGINATASDSRYCIEDTLDPAKVKGKIVFCDFLYPYSSLAVKKAGGIGIIQQTDPYPDAESIFLIPGSIVNKTIGQTITDYINSTRSPSAVIFKSQEFNTSAPHVPLFSSRGPNPASKFILKPDITAPGVSILAAYTPLQTVSELEEDTRHTKYTLMSGTSMACPHVGGVAAYIKSFYPKWSPAAIKSAIMTTARPMSSKVNEEAEFAYGAGLVNPVQALNPGLVYDMDQLTYMQFLCNAGYSGTSLGNIAGLSYVNCSSLAPGQGTDALNYPSMLLTMSANQNITVAVYRRRVTNVGPAQSIYIPVISAPTGVEITVRPSALSFSRAYQKRSFALVVKAKRVPATVMRSGSLVWRSSGYNVRSPIVIYDPQGLVV